MSGCNSKIKQRCGVYIYSPCVKYEKEVPAWSSLFREGCLDIEQTTEDLYNNISLIKNEIDLSNLGEQCLIYPPSYKVKDVLLKYETEICELKQKVQALEETALCNTIITNCGFDLTGLETECETPISTFGDLVKAILTKINS
jgi:hypothetical protein